MAIATDIDDGTKPKIDLPEPSKSGVVALKDTDQDGIHDADGKTVMGPDTTGWESRFGWPEDPVEEGEGQDLQDHTTWLEGNLADHLYGGRPS